MARQRKGVPALVETGVQYTTPATVAENFPADAGRVKRPKTAKMAPDEVAANLKALATAAETYCETELSPDRVKFLDLYKAGKMGNEQEGRSQVVMSTVRDTILATVPALLRTAFGPEPAVAFVPKNPAQVDAAEQQSDYISTVFRDAPNALLNTQATLMDGLLCRTGFVKWWWEPYQQPVTYDQTGITAPQVALYAQDPACTYTITKQYAAEDGTPLFDCAVTKVQGGRSMWCAVPPEEILWNRDARDWQSATVLIHRQDRTVGECVADGFDYDEVVEFAKSTARIDWNEERLAREQSDSAIDASEGDETSDPSLWRVAFYEAYVRMDEDGDRIPELRRYWMVGPFKVIKRVGDTSDFLGEAVNEHNIAGWCPYPMAHTPVGQGQADLTADLQRVDTALVRANLDSLGLALNPRIAMQKGMVEIKDVLNTEVGALIRTEGPPANVLQEFGHNYIGKESFPMMQWMQDVKERRTGKNMESQGLNADALQSSTKQGVQATLSAAQSRDELMARLWAENIARPLFRGLYRLEKQHQDRARVVRMRGRWVEVDPRLWDDDCEVQVVLGLGMGLAQERLERHAAIKAAQEGILQILGPANPVVGLDQYTYNLHKMIQIAGDANADAYITRISKAQAEQLRQMAAQQPKQEDPAAAVAKAQAEATLMQAQTAQQRLQLDAQKFQFEQQLAFAKLQQEGALAEEKLRQEFALKTQEMELRYQSNVQEANLDAFIRGREHQAELLERQESAQIQAASDVYAANTQAQTATTVAAIKAQADVVKAERAAANRPVTE